MVGFLKKLFGGSHSASLSESQPRDWAKAVAHGGYLIHPEPQREGDQWRVAGIIVSENDPDGAAHQFIRADVYMTKDDAIDVTIRKAKQIIHERGKTLLADQN